MEFVHRKEQVTDRAQAGFVGEGAVVHNGNGLGRGPLLRPEPEDIGELAVCDDDMLVNLRDCVNIVQHPPQNGVGANLQKRLWEVLGELP